MSGKLKEVEKMIVKVMKKKECGRNAAIDYMLAIATGRLAALWRYDESLPEGKANKGILIVAGRKKRAPKSLRILPVAAKVAVEVEPKAKPKPKPKPKAKPKAKADKSKATEGAQLEMIAAAEE